MEIRKGKNKKERRRKGASGEKKKSGNEREKRGRDGIRKKKGKKKKPEKGEPGENLGRIREEKQEEK